MSVLKQSRERTRSMQKTDIVGHTTYTQSEAAYVLQRLGDNLALMQPEGVVAELRLEHRLEAKRTHVWHRRRRHGEQAFKPHTAAQRMHIS